MSKLTKSVIALLIASLVAFAVCLAYFIPTSAHQVTATPAHRCAPGAVCYAKAMSSKGTRYSLQVTKGGLQAGSTARGVTTIRDSHGTVLASVGWKAKVDGEGRVIKNLPYVNIGTASVREVSAKDDLYSYTVNGHNGRTAVFISGGIFLALLLLTMVYVAFTGSTGVEEIDTERKDALV